MATVPKADRILTVKDAANILDELLPVKRQSFALGLKLKLQPNQVYAIHQQHQEPEKRLYYIVNAFLRLTQPRPTWRVIIDALKNPALSLPAVARKVEAAHFPANTTKTDDVEPESTYMPLSPETTDIPSSPMLPSAPIISDTESTTTYTADDDMSSSSLSLVSDQGEGATNSAITTRYKVRQRIFELKRRFDSLTNNIRDCLENHVNEVADALTSLTLDEEDQHRLFTQKIKSDLFKAANISILFGTIKPHWNYLDPSLMEYLVTKFNLKEVKDKLRVYKSALQEFRTITTLTEYCQTQKRKHISPPKNFGKVVAHFEWPEKATLEDVEKFRQEYIHRYSLHKCAMILARHGSVIVTWFIPKSIEKELKKNVPRDIFKKYFITKMEIAATCIYEVQEELSLREQLKVAQQQLIQKEEQLQSSEREKFRELADAQQQLRQKETELMRKEAELTRKEAELTRAEEAIRREQQQIQKMRKRKAEEEPSTIATEMESRSMEVKKLIVDSDESGALILSQQSFVYIGKKLDFVWREGGISLHFPAAASSKTNIEISVAVVGDVQKHSILQLPYRLMTAASATYKITASAPLPVAVKVRMQHCVVLESGESLTLMVADRGPPYYFKPLPGAIFPPDSSYGEIEVQSFSFFQFLKRLRRHTMRLSIQVFYHEDSTATFVVTKNLPLHLEAVEKSIKHVLVEAVPMTCKNSVDAITLFLPIDSNGWHVSSRFKPAKINIIDVDMYEPRQTCPKIILQMEWKGSGHPTKGSVSVPIQGGSVESFDLLCKPTPQKQGLSLQVQIPASSQASSATTESTASLSNPPTLLSTTTESPTNLSDPPNLQQLQTIPKRSGGVLKIIEEVTGKNHDLGIRLLNDSNGAITNNIEREHRPDQTRITKAIFQKWLQGTGKNPRSWATLITVLKEIDHTTLAKDIRDSFPS